MGGSHHYLHILIDNTVTITHTIQIILNVSNNMRIGGEVKLCIEVIII